MKLKKDLNKKKLENRNEIKTFLSLVMPAALTMVVLFGFILFNGYVPSESMKPTIEAGNRIIGNRLAYKFGRSPKCWDIIIFKKDLLNVYVKRVIGVPGDIVELVPTDGSCKLIVNDEEISEDYISEAFSINEKKIYEVPEDSYFVMGDNRNHSYDSREWDDPYVKKEQIIAKAICIYFPKFKIL